MFIGATGKITTVDLPMRVVVRVDRQSIGCGPNVNGDTTIIAWVKPQEIALLSDAVHSENPSYALNQNRNFL